MVRFCLSLPVLLGISLPIAAGQAAERHLRLDGSGLALDGLCARQVTIAVDPALHAAVAVDAAADHPEELDRLAFQSDGTAKIRPARDADCWRPSPDGSFEPTLRVSLRMPEAFPLAIDDGGDAHYAIGATGPLTLDVSGAGTIEVAQVSGNATLDLSGSTDLAIGQADMDRLNASLSGSGSVAVTRGRIGRAALEVGGSGTLRIDAGIGDATAEVSGSGSVRLASVSGTVRKEVSGSGNMTIGTTSR